MYIDKPLYLYQYIDGYRYNSDSLLLYDFISDFSPKGKVLDVGSGSGILGLLVKRDFRDIELSQIDIQKEHYALTCKNADYNNLSSKTICASFIEHNFESNFDMVISNPPFYHKGTQKSENKSLEISRHSDSLPFEDFAKKVSLIIKERGSFVFCYDAKQIDTLMSTLLKYKLKVNDIRFVHTKKDKEATLVLIHAKKSSKTLCKIIPPLYMNSEEVERIYNKTKTESLLWEK